MSDEINKNETDEDIVKEMFDRRFKRGSYKWFGEFFVEVRAFLESNGFQVISEDVIKDVEHLAFDIDGERIEFEREPNVVDISGDLKFRYMGKEFQITRLGCDLLNGGELEIGAEQVERSE